LLPQAISRQAFKGLNINGLHKSSIFTKMLERLWPRDDDHHGEVRALTETQTLLG
jgi:hypothetical protein